ncbi:MAG: STAS domain-containing protein [Spirochaetia bacterium]
MFSVSKNAEITVLNVKGKLTFETAGEFHRTILEALDDGSPLEIHLNDMEQFDLSGVQLLLSVCRSTENVTVIPGKNESRLIEMLKFTGILLPGCIPKGMMA